MDFLVLPYDGRQRLPSGSLGLYVPVSGEKLSLPVVVLLVKRYKVKLVAEDGLEIL